MKAFIHFVHGKESGPWGTKIKRLAKVAEEEGFVFDSLDYSNLPNKIDRVDLLKNNLPQNKEVILVGSSMGGWVSSKVAEDVKIKGLFLMAPAINYLDYEDLNPVLNSGNIFIVHGWDDEVIPVSCGINFASKLKANLLLVNDDHRLKKELDLIENYFRNFLKAYK